MTQTPGSAQSLTCPQCGLVVTIKRIKGGARLSYNAREWKRLCKNPELDSPVLCLLDKGGRAKRSGNGGGPNGPKAIDEPG